MRLLARTASGRGGSRAVPEHDLSRPRRRTQSRKRSGGKSNTSGGHETKDPERNVVGSHARLPFDIRCCQRKVTSMAAFGEDGG
jgi:hypothetical protein